MFSSLESKNYRLEELSARQGMVLDILQDKVNEIVMLMKEYESLNGQIIRTMGSAVKATNVKVI